MDALLRHAAAHVVAGRWVARAVACALLVGGAQANAQSVGAPARASTAGDTVHVIAPPRRLPASSWFGRLRVYLPPGYASGTRRYPVLYMFDGQNLFDDATSYVGEWGVDEAMDALARETGFEAIVVGVDHGGERRFNELIPYANWRYAPNQGVDFVDALVREVKPFIDATYRTRDGRGDTAILGSSLGGLAADYAIHRYPGVFSRAGVFSPSYWVSQSPFEIARAAPLPAGSRVYLFMGGREGAENVAHVERMATLLRAHDADGVALRIDPDAEHNERAWRGVFPEAVRWLFALPAPPG